MIFSPSKPQTGRKISIRLSSRIAPSAIISEAHTTASYCAPYLRVISCALRSEKCPFRTISVSFFSRARRFIPSSRAAET